MFKNHKPGKRGFADAFAAGAAGAAAFAAAAGATAFAASAASAGESKKGANTVSVSVTGGKTGGASSTVEIGSISVGGAAGGASTTKGVVIVDGKVWIDGREIPDDVTEHRSADGAVWIIQRKDGTVHVSSGK